MPPLLYRVNTQNEIDVTPKTKAEIKDEDKKDEGESGAKKAS